MSATHDESKRNRRTAKRILAIGLPLVLIAGAGVGYAWWSTSAGNGTGTATADSTTTPVVLTVANATGLYPGKFVDLAVTAQNPNDYDVSFPTLTMDAITAAPNTCLPASKGVSASFTPAASPIVVTKNAAAQAVGSVRVTMAETGTDQTSCRGAVFTVTVHS
jgi:uncharacterized cupredoxin-like copper-binding protein